MHNYSLFWGLWLFPRLMNPGARFRVGHKYSQFWPILASFVDYYLLVWGCGVISMIDSTPGCVYMSVINTRSFSRFWPVSLTINSLFWGPGVISTIDEPRGAFTCRSSTLVVLADSGPFRAQLLTVLGSRTISTIDEPWGAFSCWS